MPRRIAATLTSFACLMALAGCGDSEAGRGTSGAAIGAGTGAVVCAVTVIGILPCAIVGGAFSNVIDRLRFGWVVDFIHADIGFWPYVFNLADSAIVCGVAALVLDGLLSRGRRTGTSEDASAR